MASTVVNMPTYSDVGASKQMQAAETPNTALTSNRQ